MLVPYSPPPFSSQCYLLVSTPADAHCCVPSPVCPTALSTCPPAGWLHPPAHGPAPPSRLTGLMLSCSSPPCCHQYPPLLHCASSSPAHCCQCGVVCCPLLPDLAAVHNILLSAALCLAHCLLLLVAQYRLV